MAAPMVVGPEAAGGGGGVVAETAGGVEASSEVGSRAAGPDPPIVQWRRSRIRHRWSWTRRLYADGGAANDGASRSVAT